MPACYQGIHRNNQLPVWWHLQQRRIIADT
jgi:hypothetical protein